MQANLEQNHPVGLGFEPEVHLALYYAIGTFQITSYRCSYYCNFTRKES